MAYISKYRLYILNFRNKLNKQLELMRETERQNYLEEYGDLIIDNALTEYNENGDH